VTLTIQNVELEHAPRTLVSDLLKAFRRLQRSKLFRAKVAGGLVAAEITDKGNGLHPHLHLLADCRWLSLKTPEPHHTDTAEERTYKFKMAAQELQAAWSRFARIDYGASIWIRRCDAGAAAEIVGYALKSEDVQNCQGRIGPVLHMLDACRTVRTFGTFRGVQLDDGSSDYQCTCPNGHSDWTPRPPIGSTASETRFASARDEWRAERAAQLDAELDRIVAEEAAREV